jgi:hypothetical protein
MPSPTADGQLLVYPPTLSFDALLAGAGGNVPPGPPRLQDPHRIYYVNGIQTDPPAHVRAAELVASIAERPVHGVFNASGGLGLPGSFAVDLAQCFADWSSSFAAKVTEYAGLAVSAPVNAGRQLGHALRRLFDPHAPAPHTVNLLVDAHRLIPEAVRVRLVEGKLGLYNRATQTLYRELRGLGGRPAMVVAHSQGNLITCDALWAMVYTYGEQSLDKLQIYSLASPAPGWPLGIRYRRKVFGFTNDPVPGLADPHNWLIFKGTPFGRTAGDWRTYSGPGTASGSLFEKAFAPHDIPRNVHLLNFANRLRIDLGLQQLAVPAGVT